MTNNENPSAFGIERKCIGVAFGIGVVLLIPGIFGDPAYMIAAAMFYSGSIIATAIRDSNR